MGIEIEKKYTIKVLPEDLLSFPFHEIEQGYLNTDPAIRVRKEDAAYYMTYKGQGVMKHTEYNLPLDEVSYRHLLKKADGNIIRKKRYLIPLNADAYTALYLQNNPLLAEKIENREMVIELDVFQAPFERIVIAEVERQGLAGLVRGTGADGLRPIGDNGFPAVFQRRLVSALGEKRNVIDRRDGEGDVRFSGLV